VTVQALPYIMLLGFLFGSSLIVARFGVAQFHPLTYIGLRAIVASLSYGAFYVVGHRRRLWPTDPRLWRHAILLGLLGTTVPMIGVIGSLQYLSSGLTAVLITVGPALTVLFSHFWLADETLTYRKGVGIMLALAGAVLIAARGESGLAGVGQANPLGYLLVFMAVIFGSSMAIYARKFMRHFDSFDVATIRMLVVTVIMIPIIVGVTHLDLHAVNGQGYFSVVYTALAGNFGGMFLAFYIIKRFGVTAAAMTDYIIPVVAGLGGIFVLGEQITIGMMIGMGLIVLGVTLVNRRQRYNPKPELEVQAAE
jgi:drug/metabolite transporter (DMT)-like permease